MASGSYNIDTFSWYRSLPLSNDTTPFSTLTMFAVGPSSFMKNYTFYDYTWANGFPDTSTFSVSITNFVDTAITSTTQALGKTFMSTIPLVKWVNGGNTYEYPVPGTTPQMYDYTSNFGGLISYPTQFSTPTVWIGEGLTRIINSQEYNVFVDVQYSLYVSTLSPNFDPFTWVSTTGKFKSGDPFVTANTGRVVTTRAGNQQYIDVHSKLMFAPQPPGQRTQIVPHTSSFYLEIALLSSAFITGGLPYGPAFDLFVPGNNNFTFTCVPAVPAVTIV